MAANGDWGQGRYGVAYWGYGQIDATARPSPTGIPATASLGTITVAAGVNVSLSGVEATGTLGTATAVPIGRE